MKKLLLYTALAFLIPIASVIGITFIVIVLILTRLEEYSTPGTDKAGY